MKRFSTKRIVYFFIGLSCAVVLLFVGTSRWGLSFQLEMAGNSNSKVWEDMLLNVLNFRYGDDPEIQRVIGLVRYDRSTREWDAGYEILTRVIESNCDGDTKITPLVMRAKMLEVLQHWNEAIKDLENAKALVLAREAKGIHFNENERSDKLERRLEFDRKQMARP